MEMKTYPQLGPGVTPGDLWGERRVSFFFRNLLNLQ
jgi:hypothetical protein